MAQSSQDLVAEGTRRESQIFSLTNSLDGLLSNALSPSLNHKDKDCVLFGSLLYIQHRARHVVGSQLTLVCLPGNLLSGALVKG